MNMPRISIVTPSYNQAKYLPETIESILNQSYPNLEYIIVDGGSTDGSVEVIKRYERHLAYWISETDSGQSEAINKGFARCTGDLFNWINSDDILFPGALHRIAEAFLRHPDAALIVGDNARSDQEGRILRISAAPRRITIAPSGWVFWVAQQSTFVSVRKVRDVGRIREDLHCLMDGEFYYRILSAQGRLVRVKGPVGMIREHPQAKGTTMRAGWDIEREKVLNQYGIPPFNWRAARARMKILRLFDGSYLRSYVLSRKWVGSRPWEGVDPILGKGPSLASLM